MTDPEGEIKLSKTDLHGTDYHLVAADLSNLTNLEQKLIESEVGGQNLYTLVEAGYLVSFF